MAKYGVTTDVFASTDHSLMIPNKVYAMFFSFYIQEITVLNGKQGDWDYMYSSRVPIPTSNPGLYIPLKECSVKHFR